MYPVGLLYPDGIVGARVCMCRRALTMCIVDTDDIGAWVGTIHRYEPKRIWLQQGGGGKCPPNLNSRRPTMYWEPSTFTTIFIFIGWSPLHTYHHSSAPSYDNNIDNKEDAEKGH